MENDPILDVAKKYEHLFVDIEKGYIIGETKEYQLQVFQDFAEAIKSHVANVQQQDVLKHGVDASDDWVKEVKDNGK